MMHCDEQIQTLRGLGLTFLQAQTYLALAKLGKANVKTIAKASNVARQDVYRIMPTLQKMGLGEKIIAKPTMYKATPIKEGISILLQNKKTEYAELKDKTALLIDTFQANNAKIDFQDENTNFIITSEITLFLKMQKSLHQKAQENIDIIVPLRISRSKLREAFSNLNGATRRGVKIRLIIQKAEKKLIPKELQALKKNPFFELKYLATPVPFGMHIFDKKEVTRAISKNGLPSLWSNSSSVVQLATTYFNEMWNKAQKTPNLSRKRKRNSHTENRNQNSPRLQTIKTEPS